MGTDKTICRSHWLQRERGAPQGQERSLGARPHMAQSTGRPHLSEPCRIRAMGRKRGSRYVVL